MKMYKYGKNVNNDNRNNVGAWEVNMGRNDRYSSRGDNFRSVLALSGIGLLLAIITFLVIFLVYNRKVDSLDLGKQDIAKVSDTGNSFVDTSEATKDASSGIGKTVNEVLNSSNRVIGVFSDTNNTVNNAGSNNTNNTITNSTKTTTPAKVEVPDPVFKKPVEGKILLEYAKDNLVFSNTLQEWVTHLGIDIASSEGTAVKASADGTVDSIKNDPRYGLTVIIKHVNGYKTIYSNLATANFVKKGNTVKSGQSIGTVGKTAAFEVEDEPHLHFEITKNNTKLNPSTYLK